MVVKVTFWFLERSRLIAKASFDVMILKSLFLYSLFITRPMFYEKGNTSFLASRAVILNSIITRDSEIYLFVKERLI